MDAVHGAGPTGSAVGIGRLPIRASPINARAAVLGCSHKAVQKAGDARPKAGSATGPDTRRQPCGPGRQVCGMPSNVHTESLP